MGYSIEILEPKLDGTIDKILGTDGQHKLDGRLGWDRATNDAIDYTLKLKHIKPHIVGFRLFYNGQYKRDWIFP